MTLATLLSGAFGAALLSNQLGDELDQAACRATSAAPLALIAVTLVISFFTLVFGELAPKRLALQRAERVALVRRRRSWTGWRCWPGRWSGCCPGATNLVVQLLGGDPAAGRGVMTDEELRDLVAGHQALSPDERHIVGEVFDAGQAADP